MSGVKRSAIGAFLIVLAVLAVLDLRTGGDPAAVAKFVEPGPPGCKTFGEQAVSGLFDERAIEIHGEREMPDAECTWHVPGTTTGAVLYAQTPSSLQTNFPGLTLEQVLRQTRPAPDGDLVTDVNVNGRAGWSMVMIASPENAVTTTTWIADGKLYSLAMTRRTDGYLKRELSDIHPAVIAIDRSVSR